MISPLMLSNQYPDISEVKVDLKSASIIYFAYSGLHGELGASIYNANRFFCIYQTDDEQTKNLFLSIMLAEICHFEILGNLLEKLGVDSRHLKLIPHVIDNGGITRLEGKKNLKKALLDGLSFELVSIETYKKLLKRLKNQKVKSVIERIILDEEYHAEALRQKIREKNIQIS